MAIDASLEDTQVLGAAGGEETPATVHDSTTALINKLVDRIRNGNSGKNEKREERKEEPPTPLQAFLIQNSPRLLLVSICALIAAYAIVLFGLHVPVYYKANQEYIAALHGEISALEVQIDGTWQMLTLEEAVALAVGGPEALGNEEILAWVYSETQFQDAGEVRTLAQAALENDGWKVRLPKVDTEWTAAEADSGEVEAIMLQLLTVEGLLGGVIIFTNRAFRRRKAAVIGALATTPTLVLLWNFLRTLGDGTQPVFFYGSTPSYTLPGPGTVVVQIGLAVVAVLAFASLVWVVYSWTLRLRSLQLERTFEAAQNWVGVKVEEWTTKFENGGGKKADAEAQR